MILDHVEAGAAAQDAASQTTVDIGELMMHHTADGTEIEIDPFFHFDIADIVGHWEVHLGGMTIDLTPTKHVLFMILAATLVFLTMWRLGRTLEKQRAGSAAPKGLANMMEAFVLWVREDICITNMGRDATAKFAPFIMTLFFFILYGNFLGLVPWGASFTGNIAVTAGMAIMAFLVIEISGMRALGLGGYMRTIFPKVAGMSGTGAVVISVAMAPIEILGKLVKPFALCFRLFGNMTAGHFVILVLFGFIFMVAPLGFSAASGVGVAAATMVTLIMLLEIIVAFVQAYVFAIITAVLIGMMQHEH
jgi:F-type H+-transporting ATPase subunit a